MDESSITTEIASGLCLILDQERPVLYQQCKARDVKPSKLIRQRVTAVQVHTVIVADVHDL